jgi:DNA-binding NarL/FixJ family response regulator
MMASTFGIDERPKARENYAASVNQRDFLSIIRAGKRDVLTEPELAQVHVPALVMSSGGAWDDMARPVAAALPNARLVVFAKYGPDLYGGDNGEPPYVATAIEEFLESLAQDHEASKAGRQELSRLSAREIEVLRLVVQGKTNREIADDLVISEHTVINHVRHIFEKTGTENRAGATAYAFRHQLV